MHRKFGRNDVILIVCLILLCLVAYGGIHLFGAKKGNEVTITRDDKCMEPMRSMRIRR